MRTFRQHLWLVGILFAMNALPQETFFRYDQSAHTVQSESLLSPLVYDAAIATSGADEYLTWLEFRPGKGDVIWIGRKNNAGKWLEKQQVTPSPGDYASPTLTVDAQTNLWLTYEKAIDGEWKIFAECRRQDQTNFVPFSATTPTGAVNTSPGANVAHRTAAASQRGIWIIWQSDNQGQFDIFARTIGSEECTIPVQVSTSKWGDWHPDITVAPDGQVFAVWDSYDGITYNIQARQFASGKWGETYQVTSATNFCANARIVSDQKSRIWIAWEEDGPNWGKAYRPRMDGSKHTRMSDDVGSLHRFRKLQLSELVTERQELKFREIPQPSFAEASARTNAPEGIKQLGVFYQSPQLAIDGANRLWLVYRHFYMPTMGITGKTHVQNDWGIYARSLAEDKWSELYRFDEGQGDALQRISITGQATGIGVAWTFGRTDRRDPQNWVEDKLAPEKVVAHVATKGSQNHEADEEHDSPKGKKKRTSAAKAALTEASDKVKAISDESHRGVAVARVALNSGSSTPAKISSTSIYRGEIKRNNPRKPMRPAVDFHGKHYELYYGDFHRHTDISLCFWPGDGTMDDAYRYGIDAAPLDFLGVTDHTHDIAMGDPLSLLWQRIRKEVNRHALSNSFIPFYSYERSRGETDHNVISLRDDMLRPHTYAHSEFWKELDTNTFTIPHQPFNSVLWKTNDRSHRPLMEIFQGFRNHTCESDAREGLASGNEVGFIASSDHLSTGASYACVWAENPTRESLFRALQARRTFAATDKILLRMTCGDHWMGEKFTVKKTEKPKLDIEMRGTAAITRFELFVDGESQDPKDDAVRAGALAQKLSVPLGSLSGSHVFFVKVTQADGNMAWSSPLWITIQP